MAIEVTKPGLATSVQDQGRQGNYHLGIPPAGALDQLSFRAANLLLGNHETAAVLECALMGPDLTFTEDTHVAVTGPACNPRSTVRSNRWTRSWRSRPDRPCPWVSRPRVRVATSR